MKYYMTANNNGTVGFWKECKAETLNGAKREATGEYGDGYISDTILIATGDDVTERRVVVAGKSNAAGAKWASHEA